MVKKLPPEVKHVRYGLGVWEVGALQAVSILRSSSASRSGNMSSHGLGSGKPQSREWYNKLWTPQRRNEASARAVEWRKENEQTFVGPVCDPEAGLGYLDRGADVPRTFAQSARDKSRRVPTESWDCVEFHKARRG
jgi:hypothetical protein